MTNQNTRAVDIVDLSKLADSALIQLADLEHELTPLEKEITRRWSYYSDHAAEYERAMDIVGALELDPVEAKNAVKVYYLFDRDVSKAEAARRALDGKNTPRNNRAIDSVSMSQMDDSTLRRWASLEPVLTPLEAELIRRWADYLEINAAGVEAVSYYTDDPKELETVFDIADAFDRDEDEVAAAKRALTFVRNQEGFDAPVNNLLKLRERLLEAAPEQTGGVVLMPAEEYTELMESLRRLDSEIYEAM